MHRMQVQLSEEQVADLRRYAAASGQPVAELVREAVEDWRRRRHRTEIWDRAMSVIGTFDSGRGDVSVRHDHYLGEGDW